jgi:hypothetical protein
MMKQASFISSTVQGGGKRRAAGMAVLVECADPGYRLYSCPDNVNSVAIVASA